jgi:hypothetical protein
MDLAAGFGLLGWIAGAWTMLDMMIDCVCRRQRRSSSRGFDLARL